MENFKEKISVVVPIYKVEAYITDCIDSILNQSYKNLQIILVDDGSPDSCPEICDDYAKKDSRVTVIHQKNKGLSGARNAGLKLADGNWICFIDSDDFISSYYVENLLKIANKFNCDIVECNYLKFYKAPNIDITNGIQYEEKSNIEAISDLYKKTGCTVLAWNKLFKKSLFEGISFPEGKLHEDVATTYKLFYKSEKVVKTTEILYFYRQRNDSITTTFNEKRLDIIEAYNDADIFFREKLLPQFIVPNLQINLNLIIRFYSETKTKDIKKRLRILFSKNYKKYLAECKVIENIPIKIRYLIFKIFPFFDIFFIKIVDFYRGNK